MSDRLNNNPNTSSESVEENRLRGRYATHPAPKKKERSEADSPAKSEAAKRPERSQRPAAKPADSSKRPTPAKRPAKREEHAEQSTMPSPAQSRAEAAMQSAAREYSGSAGRPGRSARSERKERAGREARSDRASREQRAERTPRSDRGDGKARSDRSERPDRSNRSERPDREKRPTARTTRPRAKEKAAPTPAEYTPYGFEPSARMGRLMRRAPYVAGGVLLLAAIAFVIVVVINAMPIKVTVNGETVKLSEEHTVQAAFEAAGKPAKAGDLYDVEGEILKKGGGDEFAAAVNGKRVKNPDSLLEKGDAVVFSDGADVEEPLSNEKEVVTQPKVVEEGSGPIHVVSQEGATGLSVKKTGEISGKTAVEVVEESKPRIYTSYQPNVGNDMVIALTFDDGPWDGTTQEILDVLAQYEAKATFFTLGTRIEDGGQDAISRMIENGHQVCTHTWSHASGSGQGVNLSYMKKNEQREEIEKGHEAISDVTGQEASMVFRAPGGNFPIKVWKNVTDLVSAEIGWNIDTEDWRKPGADAIAEQILASGPGSIVLMHDGGGDRSQTVAALKQALPILKEQGYRFITIDELLKYPME